MNIRNLSYEDLEQLKQIHKRYFRDEFIFEDFLSHMLKGCCVVDDKNQIITAANIRPIAEIVMLTNKAFTVRQRKEALELILIEMKQNSKLYNFTQSHAFVQDEGWTMIMKKYGFRNCAGTALVIDN